MYRCADDVLSSISPHEKAWIVNSLEENASLAKDFYVDQRPEVINPSFSSACETRSIGKAIQSAFAFSTMPKGCRFVPYAERTNKFGDRVSRLESDEVVIHLGKTLSRKQLPSPAKYRLRRAKVNEFPDGDRQMEMFVSSNNHPYIGDERYYAIVIYGLDNNKKLSFARLVVPDSSMQRILASDDLMAYKGKSMHIVEETSENTKVVKSKRRKRAENEQQS